MKRLLHIYPKKYKRPYPPTENYVFKYLKRRLNLELLLSGIAPEFSWALGTFFPNELVYISNTSKVFAFSVDKMQTKVLTHYLC